MQDFVAPLRPGYHDLSAVVVIGGNRVVRGRRRRGGFAGAEGGEQASKHVDLQVGTQLIIKFHFRLEIDLPRWPDRDPILVKQDRRRIAATIGKETATLTYCKVFCTPLHAICLILSND
jgi:hypothetical protein